MIRGSGVGGRRRSHLSENDVNPMEYVANLADVMLVFACGLMVSIILNWNINLSANIEIIQKESLVETKDEMEEIIQNSLSSDAYQERGAVYEDPKTGKMYIIMPDAGDAKKSND